MSAADDKRKQRERALRALEDHIGEQLRESERNGELRAAPSYGRPLAFDDGYDETPPELRMAMKVLKDAGVVPPEVEAMREAAALEARLQACSDEAERRVLQQRLSEKRQAIALRLEALARHRTL
jgi:DNA-binding transcriptional ArsR family regulator